MGRKLFGLIGWVFNLFPVIGFSFADEGAGQGAGGQQGGQQGGQGGQQSSQQGGQAAGQGAGGQQGGQQGGQGTPPDFAVPDAYKDKGWAKKVKSLDDVFQQIDTLDSLKGKKNLIPDLDNASQEDLDAFVTALRGNTKVEDYVFPDEINKEAASKVAQILHKRGLPKSLANGLIDDYVKFEQGVRELRFSKDGLDAILKESFGKEGGDYQKVAGVINNFTKSLLNEQDRNFIDNELPNDALGVLYRLTHAFMQGFGVKEGDIVEEGGGGSGGDITKEAEEIRKQMRDLESKPHSAEQKKALQDKLTNLYKKRK